MNGHTIKNNMGLLTSWRSPAPPQAWVLSCIPEFARHTVAELNVPNLRVDSSQFPQIYQRDEG